MASEADAPRPDEPHEVAAQSPPAPAQQADGATKLELLKLYELSLQEYRFQVNLNWDRTKHYFVFNGALLATAGAVLKLSESTRIGYGLGGLLLLAGLNALLGAISIQRGHAYYRSSRDRTARIEKRLRLDTEMALMVTHGMKAQHGEPVLKREFLPNITWCSIALQLVMATASLVAAIFVFVKS